MLDAITAARDVVVKSLCEQDFSFFIRYVFKDFYKTQWINNWHHDEIINLIMQIEAREVPNAVVNIPPRYGKTELCVVLWICWTMIRNPAAQFIHASYSDELALKNSATIRAILASDCIQRHWQVKMRSGTDSKGLWLTEQGGGLLAGAAGGRITGFGAGTTSWNEGDDFDGAIILDDPLKPDDALSEPLRKSVNERLSGTFHSRKNHPKVPILIVMQRLHDDDASACALRGDIMGEKFKSLAIPAISNDNVPLWERKHNLATLEAMRASNSYVFAGQYMQQPAPIGGGIIKAVWFGAYDDLDSFDYVVHSWDTAFKADQHNDPSACTVWGVKQGKVYLVDVLNKRMEYPELKRAIVDMHIKYPASHILIEDKASGQSLLQEMLYHTHLPVIPVNPVGDKLTRAVTSTAIMESGRIYLPRNAPWLADYQHQLCTFPNAQHDDMVDSTSQFVNWFRERDTGQAHKERLMKALGYSR